MTQSTRRVLARGRPDRKEGRIVKDKWEYKVVTQVMDKTYNEQMLNEMGSQGWELVSVVVPPSGPHFFFKRPK